MTVPEYWFKLRTDGLLLEHLEKYLKRQFQIVFLLELVLESELVSY